MGVRCLVGLGVSDACLRQAWLEAQLGLGQRLGEGRQRVAGGVGYN